MKAALKAGFYLFHPLWIPFIGTFLFFTITPIEFDIQIVRNKLIGVIILSILAPFAFLILFKKRNKHKIFKLDNIHIRRFYLLFLCLIILTINNFLISTYHFSALAYFFTALLLIYSLSLFFSYLNLIISLHAACLSCLLTFTGSLSIMYQYSLLYLLIPLIIILGLVCTERLSASAHSGIEIVASIIIGIFPQFLLSMGIWNLYNI